ncbi:MAG: NRDE family protein [Gammaproteobacteria bacterium]|nr:NRDE family protein [Gammaproteobacteria bacterium]
MCLILFEYRTSPARPLVVAANRDEFYARPSDAARYWDDLPHVFGGRDLVAGGTWLAVSTTGRFAAVTNYTDFLRSESPLASRGDLARGFLEGDVAASAYAAGIDGVRYQGFNLLAFDGDDLVYACNRTGETRVLQPGVYGIANSPLDDVWPKSARGIARLRSIAATATTGDLLEVLRDESSDYGPVGSEPESARPATPAFLRGKDYGTRASTAVIFDRGHIAFAEQQFGPMGEPGARTTEIIRIRQAPARAIAEDGVALGDRKVAP